MDQFEWDGRHLLGKYLALAFPNIDAEPTSIAATTPTLGVATRREEYLVPPGQFGRFLEVHSKAVLISFYAAALFRTLEVHLRRAGENRALNSLWATACDCRLHDVRMLYQLERHLFTGIAASPKSPRDLISGFCKQDSAILLGRIDRPDSDSAAFIAKAGLHVYRRLRRHALRVARVRGYRRKTIETFGPLGLGLQVQGAIAVARAAGVGLKPRWGSFPRLRHSCLEVWRTSSEQLRRTPEVKDCFEWNGNEISHGRDWVPACDVDRLRGWLKQAAAATPALYHPTLVPPLTPQGEVSIVASDWGDQVLILPNLRAWADLCAAASVMRSIDRPDQTKEDRVRPTYSVLPRLGSAEPDLTWYRRRVSERAFEAAPGRRLVVGRLDDLLLRCHAEICERKGGTSQLGDLFRSLDDWQANRESGTASRRSLEEGRPLGSRSKKVRGTHPSEKSHEKPCGTSDEGESHAARELRLDSVPSLYVAWKLYTGVEQDQARREMSFDRFYDENQDDPAKFGRWKRLTRALLDLVPRGLGPTHVSDHLGRDFGSGAEEVERFVYQFVGILSDMAWPVEVDETFEIVKAKLGCTQENLQRIMLAHDDTTAAAALRNLISGRTESSAAFARMRAFCRNGYWSQKLAAGTGSSDLYNELLTTQTMSPIGRIRSGIFLSQAQRAEHVDFAEDVMKAVLFRLVSTDYDLVAFTGDEFVIEIPRTTCSGERIREIATVAQVTAAALFNEPDFAPPCRMEIQEAW
jgi:hypothetical protein